MYKFRLYKVRMTLSVAALKLRDMTQRPTQKQIASALGVTQQAVSAWLRGEGRPDTDNMAKLESLYGIPMREWAVDGPDASVAAESDSAA